MKCMRCGVEISSDAVFCDDCLADMEKHPVKPGTPVNLPRREKQQPAKRSKKRIYKQDEQISNLRRLVSWLMTIIIVLLLALTVTTYLLLTQQDKNGLNPLPGQNYGTSAEST